MRLKYGTCGSQTCSSKVVVSFVYIINIDVTVLSFCIAEHHSLHPNTHASTLGYNHDTAGPYSDAMNSSFCHSKPVSHLTLDEDDAQ